LTSQAACLPKLRVGDRWLFFLRQEKDKPMVLDYYGNESHPVADAQEQIDTLRHLQSIGDFAIVRGRVMQGMAFDGKTVPNARVTARRESDGNQFFCNSDARGRYEFQPLPAGKYNITADPSGSYQPDDSDIDVSRGACWDLTLSRSPHAELGGHVRHPDGSPVPNVAVILMRADESSFTTSQADEQGHFTFGSLDPGEYGAGINLPGAPPWEYGSAAGPGVTPPTASLYYGGAAERSGALVVKLAADEKHDNLDFVAPQQ
jgi:Carboxypeptidase regulatory-like domain